MLSSSVAMEILLEMMFHVTSRTLRSLSCMARQAHCVFVERRCESLLMSLVGQPMLWLKQCSNSPESALQPQTPRSRETLLCFKYFAFGVQVYMTAHFGHPVVRSGMHAAELAGFRIFELDVKMLMVTE